MKPLTRAIVIGVCIIMFATPALAAVVRDTMDGSMDVIYRTVDANLIMTPYPGAPERADQEQLRVEAAASGIYLGSVCYRFTGVNEIAFRIYSPLGTFAAPDSLGELQFGASEDSWILDLQSVIQAKFDAATGEVFVYNGGWNTLAGPARQPQLTPATGSVDAAGLINYGVNVYVGSTSSRIRLEPVRTAIQQVAVDTKTFWAEDFTCAIPAGAVRVWIELNDADKQILNRRDDRTSLAWVTISGDLFAEEESKQEESSSMPSASHPEASASYPSGKTSSSTGMGGGSGSSTAPRRSTGGGASFVIPEEERYAQPLSQSASEPAAATPTAPANATRTASTVSVRGAASSQKDEQATEVEQTEIDELPVALADYAIAAQSHAETGARIYEIKKEPQADPFDVGVILYLLLVCGIIAYLLIRPKKQ